MKTGMRNERQPADYGSVAVLMGGSSAEREVSLRSGEAVLRALGNAQLDATRFDPAERDCAGLAADRFDRAFIALHGRGGEDGSMQGALETIGLPYTGSGVLGSALSMDKVRCKQIWKSLGLPTPDFFLLASEADVAAVDATAFPLMVKPAHEGSSLGMSRVENSSQLLQAWKQALEFDGAVFAERWIEGAEYTAAILHDRVLPMIRLETPHAFYDYDAKYAADTTRYICPCGLEADAEQVLAQQVRTAFDAVGASGWGRVDFMLDDSGQAWFIEVNTVPGMTDHSLVPMAAAAAGLSFDDLVLSILDTSFNDDRGAGV